MSACATAVPAKALPDLSMIRTSKGIKLEDISRTTKITLRYLEAIERRDFSILPGGVFNISYLRQYARAIEYDEWDLLAFYQATTSEEPDPPPPPSGPRWIRVAMPLLKRLAAR